MNSDAEVVRCYGGRFVNKANGHSKWSVGSVAAVGWARVVAGVCPSIVTVPLEGLTGWAGTQNSWEGTHGRHA